MANLQANLRSQYAMAVDDLPQLLASVNRLFYESTDDASYATVFFADYDDSSRKLRYANCGHLPPLLLRACGSTQDHVSEAPKVEWLRSTCTVVGLFEAWQCEIAEVWLAPGDTLVLYTDGITEATNAEGEEFGESHLLETLGSHSHLRVGPLLQAVVGAVQQFSSGGEQQDDITAVMRGPSNSWIPLRRGCHGRRLSSGVSPSWRRLPRIGNRHRTRQVSHPFFFFSGPKNRWPAS